MAEKQNIKNFSEAKFRFLYKTGTCIHRAITSFFILIGSFKSHFESL